MKYNVAFFTILIAVFLPATSQVAESPHVVKATPTGSVEWLDPGMDEIVPADAVPEIIAGGFEWTEGPLWLNDLKMLIFSDIPANAIYQWSEKDGVKLYLTPSGFTDTFKRGGETGSNGLLLDRNGKLVLCQHGDRRIARMESPLNAPEPKFQTLAGTWQGKRFNSPNDAAYNDMGDLYFTDPAYGMEKGFEDPGREIPFAGVYRCDSKGNVTLITDQLSAPNGIGFSPDGKTLYVANSGGSSGALWMTWQLKDDGTLGPGMVFFDPSEEANNRKGGPDGLKVRKDGILFATGPGGVWIFAPGGKHLGTILTGQQTSNCALDEQGKYLYMTADDYLMRIRLK